jgi:hypothetical protein
VDWTGHFQLSIAITAAICVLAALLWVFGIGEVRQVQWGTSRRGFFRPAIQRV